MPQVDEALTRRVADLARLELTDAEVRLFTAQLADVLGYVDQLSAVDVTGVEPLMQPIELETALREDVARPGRSAVATAPESVDGAYKVPPIL
jgi:aspartyl-tRNA(Asn)/glutamyl-tRNA(Gln) amidotransferase subunit C